MSHQPPVPAGNQSPYPLHEAPHPHAAEPPAGTPVAKTPERKKDKKKTSDGTPTVSKGVIGALAAAGVAAIAAAGAWAYASRSETPHRKNRKGKKKH